MHIFVLQTGIVGNAAAGFHSVAVELAGLGTSGIELVAVLFGFLMLGSAGGQGIQKHVRGAFQVIALSAIFFKGYSGIATGTMGLF